MKVFKFARVITDISEPLVNSLTKEQREFWNNITVENYPKIKNKRRVIRNKKEEVVDALESDSEHKTRIKRWRSNFLYMNNELKTHLMKKELAPEDERIVWEQGAKLAFQYSNSGHKQLRIIRKFDPIIKILGFLAFLFFCFNIYQETYEKNRQLYLETLTGKERYELIPSLLRKFSDGIPATGRPLFAEKTKMMDYKQYIAHITKPNFECVELSDISKPLNNELPSCRKNAEGDIYIFANIIGPNGTAPITSVIHENKIYNLNLDKELNITTNKIEGADTVDFNRVQYSFASAFPELVRAHSSNIIIKNKNK